MIVLGTFGAYEQLDLNQMLCTMMFWSNWKSDTKAAAGRLVLRKPLSANLFLVFRFILLLPLGLGKKTNLIWISFLKRFEEMTTF